MSFEFRVSSFESERRRFAAAMSARLASARRRMSWSALQDWQNRIVVPQATQLETRNSKLETGNPQPETFFDTEFLRKLERLHLVAKRLSWAALKGEHAVSRKGFSLEFSDYRRYQPGDDLRYVDWNIYRRLERLLVKVFTAEEEMNIYLLVDTSRSWQWGLRARRRSSTTPRKSPRRWVISA